MINNNTYFDYAIFIISNTEIYRAGEGWEKIGFILMNIILRGWIFGEKKIQLSYHF